MRINDEFPPEVTDKIDRARIACKAVRAEDPTFFATVSAIMFQHDPIGINFEDNADEYDAEAGTVIPRLAACHSAEEVTNVLHEEFLVWFGAYTAGERTRYLALANDIWLLQQTREARARE